ncbi:TPA: PBSX family phage terminase large subunit [Staphylococcus pseudintermedius]|uniref:PBSX family phage terminase large subunit n=1 Tax=Staphylococcus pseudintermedius TaxID=283734 RepID=UPI0018F59D27|nr:PBSX family phage terminase large subunit [Staphylococcus pseudintermedius]EGQ3790950.1 PBSX family phage terminase large subunit [Staphylococcus pseudintermedius]EJD8556734.1 PBSX family phage terminase large subunit [Staphylococcus pseudintermedius]ELH4357436.1 PBSX family phage terminase large subunit [Staphylococcus pseudintermedius]MBJ8298065.1 PBSX family phage terminase large subunit [Staphylococcus pseudintermedius]MBM0375740.1 PBSX family phage terminase large subunit [Staphylococc
MTKVSLNFKQPSKVFNKNIFEILFNYDYFTEVHYGGGSSGKSHGVIQKVVLKALKDWEYPRRILWLRKVQSTIKDSLFEDVKECLINYGIWDMCLWNKTDNKVELPNGAVFLFKGLDNPEKIKSIKGVSDVVMEEASEFTLNDYTQLTLRLRERKHKLKQIFLMFNPVSKLNWVYKYFFEHGKPMKGVLIRQSSYKDNKFLDDMTRENLEMLATRNPAYYKIYALGEFATLDKLVFPKYEKRIISDKEVGHLPSYFGLDFGYVNDPSAFIHVKIDSDNKKLYVMSEYVKKGMLNNEIAQVINDLGYSKEKITADSAEQKSIMEIKANGIDRIVPAMKGKDSVMAGIQFISQFDIVIDERCYKTIEEFDNYTWKKDKNTDEYYNEPVDTYNHCIDALRYAVEALTIQKKHQKKDKNTLRKIKSLF